MPTGDIQSGGHLTIAEDEQDEQGEQGRLLRAPAQTVLQSGQEGAAVLLDFYPYSKVLGCSYRPKQILTLQ